jgi:hypothetical protein
VQAKFGLLEEIPQKAVEEAQRLVIKALSDKLFHSGGILIEGHNNFEAPSDQHDRKLWYLELLEQ